MHHKPTPEVAAGAIPEAIAGVIAEVKVGVTAGLVLRVILRVALGVDDQGPLPDLNLGGG